MPAETRDLITWAIAGSSALFALVGLLLQVRRDWIERRYRGEDASRVWRLSFEPGLDKNGWKGLRLVLFEPDRNGCTIHDLTVLKPKGCELAVMQRAREESTNELFETSDPLARGRSIRVQEPMTGVSRGDKAPRAAEFHFYASVPSRFLNRAKVVISLTISDSSRIRRKSKICITSDEMIVDSNSAARVM